MKYPVGLIKHQMNLSAGHFLEEDPALFDAPFFSMTPEEAASTDPQQRGLLETAYRAFENGLSSPYSVMSMICADLVLSVAGIPIASAAGSKTSVHIGSLSQDWRALITRDPLVNNEAGPSGSLFSFLANRLSWFYDLTGPSVTLDTACSSGMIAFHLGCESLRSREADMVN